MADFITALKGNTNTTSTTNGDVAFKSTLNANLDFFGAASSKRVDVHNYNYEVNKDTLISLFVNAYRENPNLALKNLFYLRDVHQGLGEREAFRTIFAYLAETNPMAFIMTARHLSEFGRFDDLTTVISSAREDKTSFDFLVTLIAKQLKEDLENMSAGKPVSLLAKWMPSIGKKKYKYSYEGTLWSNVLFNGNHKIYRKTLTSLRSYIGIVEQKLTTKDYSFDYSVLPIKALTKYSQAFSRNDGERFAAYKESLKQNPSQISTKADKMMPHEIVRLVRKDENLANTLWESLPKDIMSGNTIVVRDGSYSMVGLPLDVATAMAIYASERLEGVFKNRFITFSANPELVELPKYKLSKKLQWLGNYTDCSNTDMDKTFKLIYNANLSADEENRLDSILIISDMQFDSATQNRNNEKSTFDKWKNKFQEAGMKMPKTIFWNVNETKVDFPTTDIDNLYLVSGFSQNVFKDVVNNNVQTAEEFMLSVLSKYDKYFED